MASSGLSPRVRGNQLYGKGLKVNTRSIPACAGEPHAGKRWAPVGKVYPRVCGGTMLFNYCKPTVRGLSPRVRGNRLWLPWLEEKGRSIPACAGEPSGSPVPPSGHTVYPRVCGGTRARLATLGAVNGLSPRVRGNHPLAIPCPSQVGSIPACAGEPIPHSEFRKIPRVYPRVCGGTFRMPLKQRILDGLSPRVRGNPP